MTDLIARKTLFGNPERTMLKISPDGKHLAWLAPRDGVLNVWVAPRENIEKARAVSKDSGRGIRWFDWTYTSRHIIYGVDSTGAENWHIWVSELSDDDGRDLTPFENTVSLPQELSPYFMEEILIQSNKRDPRYFDIHRLNVVNGEMSLVFQNDRFVETVTDRQFRVRLGVKVLEDGSGEIYSAGNDGSGEWEVMETIPAGDDLTTGPLGFDDSGDILYYQDSRERNTAAIFSLDMTSGRRELIAEDPRSDLHQLILHPRTHMIQGYIRDYEKAEIIPLDPEFGAHLDALKGGPRGSIEIASRTRDDRFWTVYYIADNAPVTAYIYDSSRGSLLKAFTFKPDLENKPLVKMHSEVIRARDGLELVVYYSLPLDSDPSGGGRPAAPLPMVIVPHGGPWHRDRWGYYSFHQWLANRGYAVISVNFRSSTGYGKAHTNAGDRQWGEAIIRDQIDTVNWAIEQRIAIADRVAVMGGSFGGYSTLAGLTMHPDVYCCGVDLVGPSSLITFLESVPEYWKPMLDMMRARIGDPDTEEGRALLLRHSPLTYVDNIRKPLLIGQGANDPRVKKHESDSIVAAMQEKSIPVSYILYPDEGHGFSRPENRLSFFAAAESFLAEHLGGRFQEIGDDMQNSSIQVPAGADEIKGLKEALGS